MSQNTATGFDATRLRVDLANLSPIAREFIATSIALFTDPSAVMRDARQRLETGALALTVEDGEVTWVEPRH